MIEIEKKYKYIFFDIFDTIVSRKINPEYVKKIWCGHIINILNIKMNMEKLYEIRNNIETNLGAENHNKGKDFEFTYQEMTKKIYETLNINNITYENFHKVCETTEIEIESKVLYPNAEIIELIEKLKKENRKIICVSDMYLSKKMIETIFSNLKINKYIDDYYISCEYLNNKKSGILYDIVIDELKIKPEDCFMIGDNENSDYLIPKSKNMGSKLIDRNKEKTFYEKFLIDNNPEKIYKKFNALTKTETNNFEHCIFPLYLFIEKLYFQLYLDNVDEVFFLSREGEFLKKLFDTYQENIYGKNFITHYLYVSRKATYIPSLKSINEENFDSLLDQYSYISINEFLKSLNFNKEEINKIKKSYIKEINTKIENLNISKNDSDMINSILVQDFDKKIGYFKESSTLKFLKNNKDFREIFEKNRKEQNSNFKKYIKEKTSQKKIIVVDIGWNGSIQNNIQNILGNDYKVKGYYFGLQQKNIQETVEKKGLIFSNNPMTKNYYLYSENRAIFEIILGASHGSANKYVNKNNKIEVELYKKEQEEKIYNDIISKIQETMMIEFKKICDLLQNKYFDNCEIEKKINSTHFNMIFNPTKEQLNFFNKIYHYENFGVFEFTKFNNNDKKTLKQKIKEHLKFFLKYSSYFYDSYWPISKLHNNKMHIESLLYKLRKKSRFKKKGII